jgi:Xaa-Pro aminopeptidase
MDHVGRLRRLQSDLATNRLDLLLLTHLPNVRYLCGFTGSSGALLVAEDKVVFFTDGRYAVQAREEVRGAKLVVARKGPFAAAVEWLTANRKKLPGNRLGMEAEHLTVADFRRLTKSLTGKFRLKDAPPLVEQLRMVKDRDELDLLRNAVDLGSSLFETALNAIRPGIRETDVAAEMEYAARKAGAEGMSFETIIAAGKRSALPHGRASESVIPADGFVVCDFGVILSGYCSDMTRTVYVGSPTEEECRLYEAVRRAQAAGTAAVKPGVTSGQVDRASRNVLKENGLAKYFTHSTGHGVGLEIHEPPRIAAGQSDILRPGMVITIEPGVYIPGRGGVRIEDMAVVTEAGCEVLTPTPKQLITI